MFLTFYSYFLAALFSGTSAFESSVNGDRSASSVQWRNPVVVAGASGYIGRAVVQELVSRGVPTAALVRSPSDLSDITRECLEGSSLVQCNSLDPVAVAQVYAALQPSVTVCCLASRNGLGADSFAVDYNGGHNLLRASLPTSHYVLLSAYCVGKPELQFQLAKLKLEAEIRAAAKMQRISHSIVRPTAYFKSLDGQIEV